ncbi:unnamed protein product [Musa hybrid cultivar]
MARIDHDRPLLAPDPPTPLSDAMAAKPRGRARVLCFILQTFVMAVALALFFLFAGVAAVVLLHLCVAGRAFRRRRSGRLYSVAVYDASDAAPVPAGLSAAEMKGLPMFEYSVMSASSPLRPPICAVCLEGFNEGERCRALPPCGHVFHAPCVDEWLVRSPGCPICRARIGAAASEPSIGRTAGGVGSIGGFL